jgi:uncharacterized tellurite resistance protein B-like protein
MNKQDQMSYLANIYHVVLADDGMNRLEGITFEDISRDIGAGYFEKKKAKELAQEEPYEFIEVSRWSDRIQNVEDMLFVAACDGVVDPGEKKLIIDAANGLGISKKQFEVMKDEMKVRYEQHSSKPN